MPPTTARRRWTVVLALQLAATLLATGAVASAADTGELVWQGEADGQAEGRWTTDPSVRPWRDADGNPAAYQDGQPAAQDIDRANID
jgi:hypothetical protein